MALGIQGVHHIGISVPDIDKAREFYVGLLGAIEEVEPLEWRDNPYIDAIVGLKDSAARQFLCRLGNTHIECFEYHQPVPETKAPDRGVHHHGYTHFALQVDDILAVQERLLAAGCSVHTPADTSTITVNADGSKSGYSATYCRDWFGNVFEIMEIHDTPEMGRV